MDNRFHPTTKKMQRTIKTTTNKHNKHQRVNDRFIMDYVRQYTYSTHQLKLINAYRFYLQVTFLSEVTNLEGDSIIHSAIIGNKHGLPTSKLKWSNQSKPNKEIWQVWKTSLLTMYCSNGLLLNMTKRCDNGNSVHN